MANQIGVEVPIDATLVEVQEALIQEEILLSKQVGTINQDTGEVAKVVEEEIKSEELKVNEESSTIQPVVVGESTFVEGVEPTAVEELVTTSADVEPEQVTPVTTIANSPVAESSVTPTETAQA